MTRREWTALIVGIATSQAIASVHVHAACTALRDRVMAIQGAGYLSVPNAATARTLTDLAPAFWGALFFSLTLGAALSLISIGVVRIFRHMAKGIRHAYAPLGLIWFVLLLGINSQGFSPAATIHILLTPLAVFVVMATDRHPPDPKPPFRSLILHAASLCLLALLGGPRLHPSDFSSLRDDLLMTHSLGIHLNTFYYRYTLYAAQAFRSLDQELFRTCRITPDASALDYLIRLKRQLVQRDYLVIPDDASAQMTVRADRDALTFSAAGKPVVTVPPERFLREPHAILAEISEKTDRHGPFRQVVFIAILLSLSFAVYAAAFAVLRIPCGLVFAGFKSRILAAMLSVSTLLAVIYGWHPGPEKFGSVQAIREALSADQADTRITALRAAWDKGLDIADIGNADALARSPVMGERYWLARCLGFSRNPATLPVLVRLLDDASINVSYTAYHALGSRGGAESVREILSRIPGSPHWYAQLYAYKALRRLGWRQHPSG